MVLEKSSIQVSRNQTWNLYQLKNKNGMEVHVLNFGGIITRMLVPDRNGKLENIVLGYKNYRDYLDNPAFLGAIIGRVAGRIAGAEFLVKDQTCRVSANEGCHHLHGGKTNFHKVLWEGRPFETDQGAGVKLSHMSPEGEDGYPGNVKVQVIYELKENNEFRISYEAETDQETPLALTNHTYFNLNGDLKGTIENHEFTLASREFLELNEQLIPTGKRLSVEGTPFDFRKGHSLKEGIQSGHPQNVLAGNGYDHYFLFDQEANEKVRVKEEKSGRELIVESDELGMVLYTGNNLGDDLCLKEGASKKYLGFCLETQGHPASLTYHDLPSIVLEPGQIYRKSTLFKFSVFHQ